MRLDLLAIFLLLRTVTKLNWHSYPERVNICVDLGLLSFSFRLYEFLKLLK